MKNLKSNIVLIGMPGCGKTTVGKVLAKRLGYKFCDMDSYIQEISKKTIKELFEPGEENFRDWETKACEELSKCRNTIIASGGGVVKREKNIEILKKSCTILFIDRPVERIINDVDINSRPLLKDGKERLYNLYDERYELYKKAADIQILNKGYLRDTIDIIINILNEK
ncbi:MAG: shikimate kinase [Clostridium sp.]|nr:shikimate kinase [Clostridium sp.]